MPAPLHGKGWLQEAVIKACKAFEAGKIKLPEGKLFTPTAVAKTVQAMKKLEAPPSTGAVAAVFRRWEEYGLATFNAKPFAFTGFTKKFESEGIDGAKAERLAKRRAEREAAKPKTEKASAKAKGAAKKAPAKGAAKSTAKTPAKGAAKNTRSKAKAKG